MQRYMRICPICAKENQRKSSHSIIYVPGWEDAFISEEAAENETCADHPSQKLIKSLITCEEFQILREISNEPSFMSAMDELKSKDIIEFNLKMSQFKSQVNQQKATEKSNVPKCPTCGSTNIEKISVGKKALGGAMFGIFSSNIRNTMHCKNCGAKW